MSDIVISVQAPGKTDRIRHEQRARYTALRDVIYVRFAGTHREYDRVNAEEI